ncbi:MAG: nuclear transport factor 2 family protein [Sphingobium sp.]
MMGSKMKLWGGACMLAMAVMAAPAVAAPAKAAPAGAEAELTGLDRLLAMEEMKNVRLTFCRSLDSHDWAALRSTMTDDFELYFAHTKGPGGPDVRPPVELKGADKFVAFAQSILKGQSIHICTMPQFLSVTANKAKALWFINGFGSIGDQSGLGFERVVEDYERVNGKWLAKKADARVEAHVDFPKPAQ